ncbi:MAG: lipopolysaccharide biosynthesis protein, partial [Candidatus Moranbacteria bacterium]|nr:lipopolysaccharide biosynthesis protein [Candidatus Moranbacteria bacterium]
IYVIVIAKFFPASSVGAFFFAQKIQSTLLHQLTISIQNVTYPALATIQGEDERLKNAYRKIIQLTTYIISPSMVFLTILAPALFSTFLHERWVIAVTYLQVLCISGLMYPLHAINQNLLQVKGRSDLFLYLEIFKKISVIITLFLTLPFGIIPMLWGRVLTSVLNYLPTVYFTNKVAKYSISEQIKDVLPIFLSSFLAGGTLVIFDRFLELPVNSLWSLLIRTALGGALFITTSYLLKLESQRTILHIAKQQLNLKTHLAKED